MGSERSERCTFGVTLGESAERLVDCQGEEGAGFLLGRGAVGMKMPFNVVTDGIRLGQVASELLASRRRRV